MNKLRWKDVPCDEEGVSEIRRATFRGHTYVARKIPRTRNDVFEDKYLFSLVHGYEWFVTYIGGAYEQPLTFIPCLDFAAAQGVCEWHLDGLCPTWIGRIKRATMRLNTAKRMKEWRNRPKAGFHAAA